MLKSFLNKSLKFQIIFILTIVISVPIVVTAWNILMPSNASNTIKSMQEERLTNLLNYFEENISKDEINNLKNNKEAFLSIEKKLKGKLEPNSRFIRETRLGIYIVLDDKNYYLAPWNEPGQFKEKVYPDKAKLDLDEDIKEVIAAKQEKIYYKNYSGFETVRALKPIVLNGETIAVIWDEAALPPNLNTMRRAVSYILVYGILSLTIGLFLMITIIRNLNKNVMKIRNGLEKMAEDLSYRLEPMGGDFHKVAESINNMAAVLQEKEKLEEQLVRADKLASLGQMISGVAHEIRNPLSIIRGTVQLMERNFSKVEGLDEYIKIIKEQSDRENRVIQELLDYARPSKQILAEVNINALIESVLAFTNKYLQDKKVKYELSLEDNLPSIFIDGEKIKQVFVNIIINACEAMEKGGTLSIKTVKAEKFIKTYFEDTGTGMDEQQLKNIFNPYYSTKPKGTGLGLSISNGIVQMHGGTIEVYSTKGKGTTFIINLPLTNKEGLADG